jgi:DNA-binding transcriptional MerR regulator
MIDERTLSSLEEKRPEGLTSAEILDIFARNDVALSEATLRKYVQLGLLPRSIRVGKKCKHQGSQGVYPVQVVRLILTIKRMMAESFTIEQIQREFLFIRSDVEQLERALDGIFGKLDGVIQSRRGEHGTEGVRRDVTGARALSRDLVARLEAIETKLGERARREKLAAS